ncbi:hypothetical protein SNEBB_006772 [Seison nebaliae]|nr:hypothetical protein SNEBB_006772 [Seison nebaliae]
MESNNLPELTVHEFFTEPPESPPKKDIEVIRDPLRELVDEWASGKVLSGYRQASRQRLYNRTENKKKSKLSFEERQISQNCFDLTTQYYNTATLTSVWEKENKSAPIPPDFLKVSRLDSVDVNLKEFASDPLRLLFLLEKKEEGKRTKINSRSVILIRKYISTLPKKELLERLAQYHLSLNGTLFVLRRRLLSMMEKIIFFLNSNDITTSYIKYPFLCAKANYNFYCFIDFEATCFEDHRLMRSVQIPKKQEIIEFPIIVLEGNTFQIKHTFKRYCRPLINQTLSYFCKKFTSINQIDVDNALPFREVIKEVENFMIENKLLYYDDDDGHSRKLSKNFLLITDCKTDTQYYLRNQCIYSEIQYPNWAYNWCNLGKAFRCFYKSEKNTCLQDMLDQLDLDFVGQRHTGIDDARNIARVFMNMVQDGYVAKENEELIDR